MSRLSHRTVPAEHEVIICGQPWTVRFVTRRDIARGTWGDCNGEKRIIRVRRDLSSVNFLDTLIHESLHGLAPYLDEDAVCDIATQLATILLSTQRIFVNHGRRSQRKGTEGI